MQILVNKIQARLDYLQQNMQAQRIFLFYKRKIQKTQSHLTMSRGQYSSKLKDIREKYANTIRDASPACLRENVRRQEPTKNIYSHTDLKQYDKYRDDALLEKKIGRRAAQENLRLEATDDHLSGRYKVREDSRGSATLNKKYNCEIFTNAKSREERLREIEKIRQDFSQSRNKTIDEFTKGFKQSRRDSVEHGGLRERTNQSVSYRNPEILGDSYKKRKEISYRPKVESAHDIPLTDEECDQLTKKYTEKKAYSPYGAEERFEGTSRRVRALTHDRENVATSVIREFDFQSKYGPRQDSENVSPIKGLSRFDSMEKSKLIDHRGDSNNYSLNNIARIQERIQNVLGTR